MIILLKDIKEKSNLISLLFLSCLFIDRSLWWSDFITQHYLMQSESYNIQ